MTTAQLTDTFTIGGDLPVHRLGYGAMQLTGPGVWGEPADRPGAIGVVQAAIAQGVDFIDTADSYGPQVSEQILAEAAFPYPDGLVIAAKAGLPRPGPPLNPSGSPRWGSKMAVAKTKRSPRCCTTPLRISRSPSRKFAAATATTSLG